MWCACPLSSIVIFILGAWFGATGICLLMGSDDFK